MLDVFTPARYAPKTCQADAEKTTQEAGNATTLLAFSSLGAQLVLWQ